MFEQVNDRLKIRMKFKIDENLPALLQHDVDGRLLVVTNRSIRMR